MSTDRSKECSRDEQGTPLSLRFRASTLSLHRRAERSGFIHQLIQGNATPNAYGLYLWSLLCVYRQLETALQTQRHVPAVDLVAWPTLYRQEAIGNDLRIIFQDRVTDALPILPAAQVYAQRIATIARTCPTLLVAHAYTRYLGDLNGGRILKRILHDRIGIERHALTFFDYEGIADLPSTAVQYRGAIDTAGQTGINHEAATREAGIAFRLNIYLSTAVARDCARKK